MVSCFGKFLFSNPENFEDILSMPILPQMSAFHYNGFLPPPLPIVLSIFILALYNTWYKPIHCIDTKNSRFKCLSCCFHPPMFSEKQKIGRKISYSGLWFLSFPAFYTKYFLERREVACIVPKPIVSCLYGVASKVQAMLDDVFSAGKIRNQLNIKSLHPRLQPTHKSSSHSPEDGQHRLTEISRHLLNLKNFSTFSELPHGATASFTSSSEDTMESYCNYYSIENFTCHRK